MQETSLALVDKRGFFDGGAGGIRTHGTVAGTPDFESFELLVTAVFLSAFSVRLVPP